MDNEEEMDGQICIGSVVKNKKSEIIGILKCKKEDIILASAKNGIGIK